MNERIFKLAEQCYHRYSEHNIDLEKFAELIVGECLMLAQSYPSQNADYAAGIDSVRESIKEHFGVEE